VQKHAPPRLGANNTYRRTLALMGYDQVTSFTELKTHSLHFSEP